MNAQMQSYSPLPVLAPTQYRVSTPVSIIPDPASMQATPILRPSCLGLMDEFEQEAA